MIQIAEPYRDGSLSLQEAATAAKVSIYEMMEFTEKYQIYPKDLSDQEMEEHFEYAKKILKKDQWKDCINPACYWDFIRLVLFLH